MAQQRYKMVLAYDGAKFHGWQEQTTPEGEVIRTVQLVARRALCEALNQPIHLTGASRTDTGVHALGQVAHFDADTPIPVERLARAINARLPDDVEIRSIEPASQYFHAIRDTQDKQYRYIIWNHINRPLQRRHYVYHYYRHHLQLAPMQDAAKRLIGEHDFASFAAVAHGRSTTVRTIYNCNVTRADHDEDEWHITVSGNGFLYNMVRIIAGTLLEIGRGHWTPDKIDELLANPDRRNGGPTLPPNGLWLEWIKHGLPITGDQASDNQSDTSENDSHPGPQHDQLESDT